MSKSHALVVTLGARFCLSLALLTLLASVGGHGWANEDARQASPFSVSGFGTLGLVYDNRDGLYPQWDFNQPDTFSGHWSWRMDSLLGLQVNASLAEVFDGVVQVVLKDRAVETLDSSLEWAFLRWRPTTALAVRAGRLGADFYLLSDYRNVGFAYLWERPPIEFYGPLLLHHFDGADLSGRLPLAGGSLQARLFGGIAREDVSLAAELGADTLILDNLWGASLTFESERWRLKAGFSRFRCRDTPRKIQALDLSDGLNSAAVQSLWPQAGRYGAELPMKGRHIGFYSLGAVHDDNRWQVSGELGVLTSEWTPLRDMLSAYLSVGRRLGNLTPYAVLATASPIERETRVVAPEPAALADPLIAELYAGALDLYDTANLDQYTMSLGARWDLRPKLALKFQWDHTRIERFGLWWAGVTPTQNRSVELLSASLSWVF